MSRSCLPPVVIASALLACEAEARPIDDFAPEPDPSLPVEPWTFVVDASVGADELEAILDAANAWTRARAASCPMSFVVVPLERMPTTGRVVTFSIAQLTPGHLGWTVVAGERAVVILRPRPADTPGLRREFRVTVRHELGHAFGLEHREDGVMASPTVSGITEADVAALRCAR